MFRQKNLLIVFFLGLLVQATGQSFTVVVTVEQAISCHGDSGGSLTASVPGGGSGYTFLWSDGQTTATAQGLVAGAYSVTVQSASGAMATGTAVLTEPAPLILSSDAGSPVFADPTASIEIETSGGTADYSWLWVTTSGVAMTTEEDLVEVGPEIYLLTATDANGCTATFGPIEVVAASSPAVEPATLGFRAFPNPAQTNVQLEWAGEDAAVMSVFDASGRLLEARTLAGPRDALDVSGWPAGWYTLVLTGEQGTTRAPLIVSR